MDVLRRVSGARSQGEVTRLAAAALLLAAPIAALSQADFRIFNVPFGTSPVKLAVCPESFDQRKVACWIGRPFSGKTGKTGMAYIPNRDTPGWARDLPRISTDASGVVESISLQVAHDNYANAIGSIAERFGAPDTAGQQGHTNWSIWSRPQVYIRVGCSDGRCLATFTTAAAKAAADARREEYERNQKRTP